jgi:gas vesicle protein GvpL/GvpF
MAAGIGPRGLTRPLPRAQDVAKVLHLYGLTKSPGPAAGVLRNVKGVDGAATIEAISCGGLISWVSRVSEADFAQNLAENMQDLDWLAGATTRHQEVLSTIAQTTDVLPARFGIEFRNEKSLRSHVESRQAALKADFERIRDKQEWGVKVFVRPPEPKAGKKVRTGKEYLEAKSALLRRAPTGGGTELLDFGKALEAVAVEVAEGGKFAAARRDLELHKTILLKRAHRAKLEKLVRSYSRKWKGRKRIECTGPWPPFSFVSQPESPE